VHVDNYTIIVQPKQYLKLSAAFTQNTVQLCHNKLPVHAVQVKKNSDYSQDSARELH
jgi:hypothetical protein